MDLSLVPYKHQRPHPQQEPNIINYKECMKNHAASIGGHANDGCCEFMPRADDSLTCAACGCHRNFHRREVRGQLLPQPKRLLLFKDPTKLVGAVDRYDEYDRRSETPEREEVNLNVCPPGTVGPATGKSKRQRTKFTQEQKDKMLEFAERIGWRMQRQDDVALNQFCNEVGVKRHVLKVWMHNNKNASHRRKDESASQSPTEAAPPAAA